VKLLLKVAVCLLINHEAVGLRTFSLANYNEFLLADRHSVLLSYHFAVKLPQHCSDYTQKEKHNSPLSKSDMKLMVA
jgi:hypothetical protein